MPRLLSRSARVAPVEKLSATEQNRALARLTEENAALTAELRVARELVTELSAGVGGIQEKKKKRDDDDLPLLLLHENACLKQQIGGMCENSRRQTSKIQLLTLKVSELKQTVAGLERELELGSGVVQRHMQALSLTQKRLSTLEAMFTEIKEQLTCPITQSLFEDPYISKDGYTFECSAIRAWTQSRGTCPLSRKPLEPRMVLPNRATKNVVDIIMQFRWA